MSPAPLLYCEANTESAPPQARIESCSTGPALALKLAPWSSDRIITPRPPARGPRRRARPKTLDEFVGQKAARENLRVFIDAAKGRGDALDHVLFFGPPGLGKTTLAQIIARELGVGFRATSGPVIAKSGDLAALLTNLEDGDVLFIDEIHRLAPAVEEILYPAMEDRALDLMIGEGPSARSVRIDLPKFTLVGATTRQGLITTPLARPLRNPGPAHFLLGRRARAGRPPRRPPARPGADRGRRPRSRPPRPRHAASCRPAASPGARFRSRGGRRRGRRPGRGRRSDPDGGRSARPRRDGPALSHDDRRHLSRAARSESRLSPPAFPSRATRSRR